MREHMPGKWETATWPSNGKVVNLLDVYRDMKGIAPAPAQDPSEMTLRDYAEAFFKAGHDFWKACRRDAGGGAVRWLSCDDGTLIVFTRGEYREAIMGAVGGYRATEVVFEDQGSDEQNGMVACAAPAQEVGLTYTDLLNALRDNSWKVEPFDMPTGQGDSDIGWRVVEFHMSKPTERTVAEIYTDDPSAAIIAALRAKEQA